MVSKAVFTLLISGSLLIIQFSIINNQLKAQCNTWTQKADFGSTERFGAVGFSIDNKGYIGTGKDGDSLRSDFWEYDTVSNTWAQKANFGGIARRYAVGFSIDSKGYIGTGLDVGTSYLQDFWEYDPVGNAWTQKADFGGTARHLAAGFSIGSKGFIGTGYDGDSLRSDFWQYDPISNSWIQKAKFGGTARFLATGFSIGNKGYIGTGGDSLGPTQDFWEYDLVNNTWTQKADFGGTARTGPVGFSIGSKGYIGTGRSTFYNKDFWEFDPGSNTWTQKASLGANAGKEYAVGFSIGGKGYIGTGYNGAVGRKDFWEYIPDLIANAGKDTSVLCYDSIIIGGFPTASGVFSDYTYSWSPSEGLNDSTLANPTSALPPDTIIYFVTVTDSNGCTVKDSVTVTVNPFNVIATANNPTITCGDTTTLNATFNSSASYSWSPVTGLTDPNAQNTVAAPSLTTTYTVTATIPGCPSSSDTVPVYVLQDSNQICLITVDSTSTKNVIVWEKPISTVIDSFKIYRDIVGTYTHIGSVAYGDLSVFTDTSLGIDPNNTAYRYKLSVLDTCGNESVLSNFHKTIHLIITLDINDNPVLQWNDYGGFVFTYYRILRDSTGLGGSWEAIDSVSFGINSYTDNTPPQTPNVLYVVEVVPPDVCTATLMKYRKDFTGEALMKYKENFTGQALKKVLVYNSARSNVSNRLTTGYNLQSSILNFQLKAYPNPYTGKTQITYSLTQKANSSWIKNRSNGVNVSLEVLNVLGEKVKAIVKEKQNLGKYQYSFSAKDSGYGEGMYILKLSVNEYIYTKKLIEF